MHFSTHDIHAQFPYYPLKTAICPAYFYIWLGLFIQSPCCLLKTSHLQCISACDIHARFSCWRQHSMCPFFVCLFLLCCLFICLFGFFFIFISDLTFYIYEVSLLYYLLKIHMQSTSPHDIDLRVRTFFHQTFQVCHVYCKFIPGYICRITLNFGTLKDRSLSINIFASKNCFADRNIFQNGIDALSKIDEAFLT